MFFTNIFVALFLQFHPCLASEVSVDNSLPTPLHFVIRLHEGKHMIAALDVRANHTVKPDERLVVNVHFAENFSSKPLLKTLDMSDGKEIRLYNQTVSSRYRNEWSRAIKAEVKTSMPIDEIIEALIQAFSRPIVYHTADLVNTQGDPLDVGTAILAGLTKSRIHLSHVSIIGVSGAVVNEETLLHLIRNTNAARISIVSAIPWSPSNAFFQLPTIKNLTGIWLDNLIYNPITDDSLLGLNASFVYLHRSPEITADGVRRYLQPVLDGDIPERSITLIPSFSEREPGDLFKGLKVTRNESLGQDWWVIEQPAPAPSIKLMFQKIQEHFAYRLIKFNYKSEPW